MNGKSGGGAVLLVAHGSHKENANRENLEMAERLGENFSDGPIIACFLEIARPSIEEGFAKAVHLGCKRITLVPYFLSTGAHVSEDFPRILEDLEKKFSGSGVQSRIAAPLGPDPALDEIVLKRIADCDFGEP